MTTEKGAQAKSASPISELGGRLDKIVGYALRGEVQHPLVAPTLPTDIVKERGDQSTNFVSVCLEALQRPEVFETFETFRPDSPPTRWLWYRSRLQLGLAGSSIYDSMASTHDHLEHNISATRETVLVKDQNGIRAIFRAVSPNLRDKDHIHGQLALEYYRTQFLQTVEQAFPPETGEPEWESWEQGHSRDIGIVIVAERPLQPADIGRDPGLFSQFVNNLNKVSEETFEIIQKRGITEEDIARERSVIEALADASSSVIKALRS